MEYDTLLEEMIMRKWHKFIYGEEQQRNKYLKSLTEKYSFQTQEKQPVGIYIQEPSLEDCRNKECELWRVKAFQREYFGFLVAQNIMDKLLSNLSNKELLTLKEGILESFRAKKIESLQSLKLELEKSKNIYKEEYYNYIKSGNIREDFQNEMQIEFIDLNRVLQRLKEIMEYVSYFAVFIDKNSDYGVIYTQVINTFISLRSTGYLVMNIGCKNYNDWKCFYDATGDIIQSDHDFSNITMNKWIRERKK